MKLLTILLFCSTMLFGQQTVTLKYLKGYKYKTRTVEVKYDHKDSSDHTRVTDILRKYVGKKVGTGICGDLMVLVNNELGMPSLKYGRGVFEDRYFEVKKQDIKPGDFMLMYDMELDCGYVKSHVQFIWKIENGVVWTIEQNVAGSPVVITKMETTIYKGDYKFYRFK